MSDLGGDANHDRRDRLACLGDIMFARMVVQLRAHKAGEVAGDGADAFIGIGGKVPLT